MKHITTISLLVLLLSACPKPDATLPPAASDASTTSDGATDGTTDTSDGAKAVDAGRAD